MKYMLLIAALVLGLACNGKRGRDADAGQLQQQTSESVSFDQKYTLYEELLKKYVRDGLVDYMSLKSERARLDQLIDAIAAADISQYTEAQKLAFYINSYNIITLRSIVDAYPVESIRDIDGVWDEVEWGVAGEQMTLDHLEHEILRKMFAEPRIHFAVVCASIGCPPLIDAPYLAATLDEQLQASARNFVGDPAYNRIDVAQGFARLSSLFDWFGDDFIPEYHSDSEFAYLDVKEAAIMSFVTSLQPEERRTAMLATTFRIEYAEYDWSLNEMK